MKKTNNKYRNNNSNQIYSLNYKFDSISIAGKISGTALDLIKKYNELAKEAHANGDFVTAEVFKQYAEHYRKIVTEINEKKTAQKVVNFPKVSETDMTEDSTPEAEDSANEADLDITAKAEDEAAVHDLVAAELAAPIAEKKEFKVIEITEDTVQKDINETNKFKTRGRRPGHKKVDVNNDDVNNDDVAV